MIPEREREALMRLTMCARGECPMCKYEEQCDNWDFRMELATKNMNILAEALRKTENSSEKPNNCECEPRKEQNFCGKCRYLYRDFKYGLSCYRLMDNEPCKYEERKDEPTISKMEQVDKDINVRSKNEPQTDKDFKVTYTCSFTDCDNFKNFGFGEKCIECKRKQSEAKHKDEQTERSE